MLQLNLESESNPLIVSDEISFLISDGLVDGTLSLRSAFLLNQEALRIKRVAYHQVSWNYTLSLSGLVALYMQRLVALSAREIQISQLLADWLSEDVHYIREVRPHYLADHILRNPTADPVPELLKVMSQIRADYSKLSDAGGPYHTEVFPYEHYSPEDVLLAGRSQPFPAQPIEAQVEELLGTIATGKWG